MHVIFVVIQVMETTLAWKEEWNLLMILSKKGIVESFLQDESQHFLQIFQNGWNIHAKNE